MADKIVYLGPSNNRKKEELVNKSLKSLRNGEGDKFYYLLPNGELLTSYRNQFINQVKKAFEINLFTFDNIVKSILKDKIYLTINDAMKEMIIKNVVDKLNNKEKIIYYKDFITMQGFIESLGSIIGSMKRSLVYPKNYLSNCPDNPSYSEIGLVYAEYEDCLEELNLVDREGAYFKAIEHLRDNIDYFKDLDFIIIDEFYDFRPIEIEIIKRLCKLNIDIYINIPFDMKSRLSNINETLTILKELGFNIEYIEKDEFNFFENIGTNFFNEETQLLDHSDDLILIKSPSIYIELKRIFEEIKNLYRKGRKLNKMSIVLLNEEYKDMLFEVALEEKVPISIRKEKPLIEVPLIKEFLNIIETKISNGGRQCLINRIKSNYFNIVEYELQDGIEFIFRKLNFNNLDELARLFQEEKSLNLSIDYIEPINGVIKKIADEINMIVGRDSIINYNTIFKRMIESYYLEDKIHDRYGNGKDFDLLYRDISALEKLKEIFDGMKQLSLIMEDILIEDYFEAFIRLIQNETILEQDENSKGVKIFNPINSRGFIHDVVFITGLSQQHYPLLKESNFFINDDNYLELKKIGLDFKSYHERLNNEAIKFSALLSSCKDRMYLSYSGNSDEASIPSIFLEEILSMFKGEETEEKLQTINLDLSYVIKDNIEKITTIEELSNYLILNHYNDMSKESKDYFSLHNSFDERKFKVINNKTFSEYKRYEGVFNEFSGRISSNRIIEDIKIFHENKVYSNTYLEAYGRCPYYFLLKNLLKVEEMERDFEEYSPIDIGNIYHEVLRHYYYTYKEDISNSLLGEQSFSVEDTLNYLMKLVEMYSKHYGLDSQYKSSLLIIENTYELLKDFIKKDINRISNSNEKLIPHSFEVEFGREGNFTIDLNGEKIKLKGKIDRIDKVLGEEKYAIMDYKSSSYGIYDIDSMEKGTSLQLPIYIMSQKDKKIVAGLYGIISKANFEIKLGVLGETKMVSNRNKGCLDIEGWDKLMEMTKSNIKDFVHGILSGDFSVNPMECSPYCIYKDICRYEFVLEVE